MSLRLKTILKKKKTHFVYFNFKQTNFHLPNLIQSYILNVDQ